MLHLRVIVPTELREQVLRLFEREAGVTHVVSHRDAGVDPVGDVVTADVAREATNGVIERLKALRLDERVARRASTALAVGFPVAMAVTTVPAAGFAVVAATAGDWDVVGKSVAQLAVNLVGITVAGVLVLGIRRRHAVAS